MGNLLFEIFQFAKNFMDTPLHFYSYTFSLSDVLLISCLFPLIGWLVGKIVHDWE